MAAAAFSSTGCDQAESQAPAAMAPEAELTKAAPRFAFFTEDAGERTPASTVVYTDRFVVRLDGVAPGREMTITAKMYAPGAMGRGYTSSATFEADAKGSIDTGTMAPIRGSYSGVDPDGLVWSAREIALEEGLGERTSIFFEATTGEERVAEASLGRRIMSDDVDVVTVDDKRIVGELFIPRNAKGRVPVIALGGSEGGLWGAETFAARLASLGYPTLALGYFGLPGLPQTLERIPLEYFEAAFEWLDQRPETTKGKVVVIGASRGGELALQLGSTYPQVVGVIAETPSSYRWAGIGADVTAAWQLEKKDLAYVPSAHATPDVIDGPDGGKAYVFRTVFEASMRAATSAQLDAAAIAIERTNGPILMIGGADDRLWPACDFVRDAQQRLEQSGHTALYADDALCLADAGHGIGTLGVPTERSMWGRLSDLSLALGGTAKGNAQAGRTTDDRVRAFLASVAR